MCVWEWPKKKNSASTGDSNYPRANTMDHTRHYHVDPRVGALVGSLVRPRHYHMDLPAGAGIGNIVLFLAGFRAWCLERGVRPVVRCQCPGASDLSGIRAGAFDFVRECPPGSASVPTSLFCNLPTLVDVAETMRDIVVPVDMDDVDCDAAFCIRTTDANHDGGAKFMNRVAVDTMRTLMAGHAKALVFSNDAANLRDLPPGAAAYQAPDQGAERNTPAHWRQWHALSRIPVVYHGVAGGADGSITSTFAPTAVVYGGRGQPVGVDNDGVVYQGGAYYWPLPRGPTAVPTGSAAGSPGKCAPGAARRPGCRRSFGR